MSIKIDLDCRFHLTFENWIQTLQFVNYLMKYTYLT